MTTPWLFAASIGLLMAFVAFTTYRSGQLLRDWTPPGNLLLSWPDNLMRLALVGLCVVLGVTLGPGPMALGWSTANLGSDLAWGAVIGLLMTGILTGAGWVVERRWGAEVASDAAHPLHPADQPAGMGRRPVGACCRPRRLRSCCSARCRWAD